MALHAEERAGEHTRLTEANRALTQQAEKRGGELRGLQEANRTLTQQAKEGAEQCKELTEAKNVLRQRAEERVEAFVVVRISRLIYSLSPTFLFTTYVHCM
jgi:DNA anti-recombination protein RmuC